MFTSHQIWMISLYKDLKTEVVLWLSCDPSSAIRQQATSFENLVSSAQFLILMATSESQFRALTQGRFNVCYNPGQNCWDISMQFSILHHATIVSKRNKFVPSPPLVQCCFAVTVQVTVHFSCYRKQHCFALTAQVWFFCVLQQTTTLFCLNSSSVHFSCHCKQHCNRGGEWSFNFDNKHFCQRVSVKK